MLGLPSSRHPRGPWLQRAVAGLSSSGYFERLDFKLTSALGPMLDGHKDPAIELNRVRVELQGGARVMLGRQ
eukprot:7718936-Alexandrium_andersonii.AAC.1